MQFRKKLEKWEEFEADRGNNVNSIKMSIDESMRVTKRENHLLYWNLNCWYVCVMSSSI